MRNTGAAAAPMAAYRPCAADERTAAPTFPPPLPFCAARRATGAAVDAGPEADVSKPILLVTETESAAVGARTGFLCERAWPACSMAVCGTQRKEREHARRVTRRASQVMQIFHCTRTGARMMPAARSCMAAPWSSARTKATYCLVYMSNTRIMPDTAVLHIGHTRCAAAARAAPPRSQRTRNGARRGPAAACRQAASHPSTHSAPSLPAAAAAAALQLLRRPLRRRRRHHQRAQPAVLHLAPG